MKIHGMGGVTGKSFHIAMGTSDVVFCRSESLAFVFQYHTRYGKLFRGTVINVQPWELMAGSVPPGFRREDLPISAVIGQLSGHMSPKHSGCFCLNRELPESIAWERPLGGKGNPPNFFLKSRPRFR